MPDVCVRKLKIVMPLQAGGVSARYFEIGSSMRSLPALLKQKDARGGELFRERADPKPCGAGIGDMPLKVCGTEGAVGQYVSITNDEDAPHK